MKYLNLGCGSRFHPDFVNVDVVSSSRYVKAHDLTEGIPFSDLSFDAVYHSHLLEHFRKERALKFLKECNRVLKVKGIIRIAVPDLEQIVRTYLQALDNVLDHRSEWRANYEWMMLELYDQAVRERPGGAMLEYLKQNPLPNEGFIYQRIGYEAARIIDTLRSQSRKAGRRKRSRNFLASIRHLPERLRASCLRILLDHDEYRAFETARFRLRGEIHYWMYDRYSLAHVLTEAGFRNPRPMTANESQIPRWPQYLLDADSDGVVYKPDSLFMEAVKD